MKRLWHIIVTLLILVIAALLFINHRVSQSLPELDDTVTVTGLLASATIARDAAGIPVITAENRADLAFATGFVHAQDRFFQMDLSRRNAAGELSELFGQRALVVDKRNRLHRFRTRASAALLAATDAERAISKSYTAGVNAGLASLGSKPPEYLLLRAEPQAWTDEDSMLVGYSMFMVLNDVRASRDIQRGIAHSVLPASVFAWMYPDGTEWDAPLSGDVSPNVAMPAADQFDISAQMLAASQVGPNVVDAQIPGSNNWAISGNLTKSGKAIVASDMHLPIRVPNTFYRARFVVVGQSDTSGLSLPGTPVMVAGSNGMVAWAFTNSYGDWTDAVILDVSDDGERYQTVDGPLEFEKFDEIIRSSDADDVIYTVRETIWGPVLDDEPYPGKQVAVRWIAHDPRAINVRQLGLEYARNVDEALGVANTMGIPPQNFVVGDADGNIAWSIAGQMPLRADYETRLPVDGSPEQGWLGWRAPEDYPRVVNPPSGRIWTANSRVVDGAALQAVGRGGYDLGARGRQIRDDLFAADEFEPKDMLAIQGDDRALFLMRWQELLLELLDEAAIDGDASRAEYRTLISSWQARAATDSAGYRLVREFRLQLRNTAFNMLMMPVRERYGADAKLRISNQFEAPLWQLVSEQPRHMLAKDYASWRELMLELVDQQIADFSELYDDGLANRTWGERNTAAIRHPLSAAVPMTADWMNMPADQLSGDANMPKVLGPAFGASERFGVSPGAEQDSYLHIPAGQSGHPDSEFYRLGHEDWVNLVATPFLPGQAQYTITLNPAQ